MMIHRRINQFFYFSTRYYNFFRESITFPDRSTLPFSNQVLKFLRKYNDETAPLFYLMKTLESFLIRNTQNFFFNLDQFRLHTATLECHQELKEKNLPPLWKSERRSTAHMFRQHSNTKTCELV